MISINYFIYENGTPTKHIQNNFPIAANIINEAMKPLIDYVNNCELLRRGIRAVNYLATTTGMNLFLLPYLCY